MDSLIEADVLVRNCSILTLDSKSSFIETGFIAIKDKRITAIGRMLKAPCIKANETIDGKGKVAVPGLVNCHTHVAMSLFRGLAEDRPLDSWLQEIVWPLETALKTSDIYDGALLGCLEMIKSGTTCFADMYFHEDTVAEAVKKAGLRAVLAEGIIEAGDRDRGRRMLNESVRISKLINGYADGRVSTRLGPHAVYSCGPDLLTEVRETALKLKIGVHMHLAESSKLIELPTSTLSLSEVDFLERIKFLNRIDILAAHCIHLTENEIHTLAKNGVKVAYNPIANMKLAMGAPKISHLLKHGVTVGLGTDGPASSNALDMIETMKMAALFQKSFFLDPTLLPAGTVLRMATIDGARALGLEKQVGSLELGKRADLILIDLRKPHLTPCHNLYANIVHSARGSDVDTVVIDGNVLMQNRKLQTLEEAEIIEKAQRAALSLTKA